MKFRDLVSEGMRRAKACAPAVREGAAQGADAAEFLADAAEFGQEVAQLCEKSVGGAVTKRTRRRVERAAQGLGAASSTMRGLAEGVRRLAAK